MSGQARRPQGLGKAVVSGLDRVRTDMRSSWSGGWAASALRPTARPLPFDQLFDQLLSLPEQAFQLTMLRRDPLYDRFNQGPAAWRQDIIDRSVAVGQSYAEQVPSQADWRTLLTAHGIDYSEQERPHSAERVVFAHYVEPDKITVFTDTLAKYEQFYGRHRLPATMSPQMVKQVLIGHELFHFFEYRDRQSVPTRNYQLVTHQWGPIKLRAHPAAMSEIAAMAFTQAWLGLDYPPNIFDVLLVYLYDPAIASLILSDIAQAYADGSGSPPVNTVSSKQ